VAIVTGGDQGGASVIVFITPIDIKVGVVPEDLLDLFDIAIFGCLKEHLLHLFQMVVKRKRKKNRRSQSKTNRVINHSQAIFTFTG